MKRHFFNALLAGAIYLVPISGFGMNQSPSTRDQYASLEDIPLPLMKSLQGYMQTEEQYITNILAPIRQNGRTKLSLDQQDIDYIKKKNLDDKRRQILAQFISYDYDFDGVVTRQDIKNIFSEKNSSSSSPKSLDDTINNVFSQFLSYDVNHDEIITYEEVRSSVPTPSKRNDFVSGNAQNLVDLLILDPNKDGRLTADELEALARKAYSTIDTNGDGILSPDETKPLGDIQRKLSELNQFTKSMSDECKPLAQMPKDEKIANINVYEGDTASSVSIAGQTDATGIISVHVEPGKDKLYLVVSAFRPTIWKISGATDRVSHLVLAGPSIPEGTQNNDMGNDKVNAGVIGISAENVEFRHARVCGLNYIDEPRFSKFGDVALQKLVGRKADIKLSQYNMLDLQIGSEGQLMQSKVDTSILQVLNKMPVPEGFDPITWHKSLMFSPGGISFEKADTVIAEVKAENYVVLPAWFGISKLIHDGVLLPVNNMQPVSAMSASPLPQINAYKNAYKIVKEMPYYPSRLTGGLSTTFILGKGINQPKGNIGHSCLVSEETGEKLTVTPFPRCP